MSNKTILALALPFIIGCGLRSDNDSTSHPVKGNNGQPCPAAMASAYDCEGGVVIEHHDGNGCFAGYSCVMQPPSCPQVAAPEAGFCKNGVPSLDPATCNWTCQCNVHMPPECPDGELKVTKDKWGCVDEITCVKGDTPNCPPIMAPGPDFCPDGEVKQQLGDSGCPEFICVKNDKPDPCPQVAAPDASFCENGVPYLDEAACNWTCQCNDHMPPECPDGTLEVTKDSFGCITDITCVKKDNPDPCPQVAAPDASFCENGVPYLDEAACNWKCQCNVHMPPECKDGQLKVTKDKWGCIEEITCVKNP